MELTGERMIPSSIDKVTFWEHVARYRFASQYVKGKRVLDIACGEGYGAAAMLQGGAMSVVGVDISKEACDHAHRRYGIETRVGNAEQIPLDDNSIDLVISFETVEHVTDPAAFIKECRRVLSPGGTLIISTPNKTEYHKVAGENRYHCSELEFQEFKQLLKPFFPTSHFFWPVFSHALVLESQRAEKNLRSTSTSHCSRSNITSERRREIPSTEAYFTNL